MYEHQKRTMIDNRELCHNFYRDKNRSVPFTISRHIMLSLKTYQHFSFVQVINDLLCSPGDETSSSDRQEIEVDQLSYASGSTIDEEDCSLQVRLQIQCDHLWVYRYFFFVNKVMQTFSELYFVSRISRSVPLFHYLVPHHPYPLTMKTL